MKRHSKAYSPYSSVNSQISREISAQVRIIGGQWRGTRLQVSDSAGLRPSSDRVRETLFNWLMPHISGARVLDVFAGSGALGLEALSRGAQHATFIEKNTAVAQALSHTIARLEAGNSTQVLNLDALYWLKQNHPTSPCWDIAFIDPPFDGNTWQTALEAVLPYLAPKSWVYLEFPQEQALSITTSLKWPVGWYLHREGHTQHVRYQLYHC